MEAKQRREPPPFCLSWGTKTSPLSCGFLLRGPFYFYKEEEWEEYKTFQFTYYLPYCGEIIPCE